MTASELKKKYLDFFVKKGHQILPNVSLVPENDPTTLFISAGMQPLVPYLLGEPHPLGKRLVSLQRCLRTGDIESAGNVFHLTFFEMLGNWSLSDYWKKESLSWSYEFLTKVLKLDAGRFHVTIFAGDKSVPKDEEAEKVWLSLGIPRERIYPLPREDNWWEAGQAGPSGPDSEIFYDTGKNACGPNCRPGDSCGRFFEMWNNVFMQFNRKSDGTYEPLKQRNVDTGMGVERTSVVLQGKEDIYQIDTLWPIIKKVEEIAGKRYDQSTQRTMRIIVDHLRAATFLIADGVLPSNTEQGYVLRRLVRRAIRYAGNLGIEKPFTSEIAQTVIEVMGKGYPDLANQKDQIFSQLTLEEQKFSKTLERGLRELEKCKKIDGKVAFFLYETYGFPFELTQEMALEKGLRVDEGEFKKALKEHQQKSRTGAEKRFKGGLADHSEESKKYHTAAHLLHAALRKVLGTQVRQAGQNITAERLRFDFTYPEKLTAAQLKKVEDLVNQKIKENLPVKMEIMALDQAKSEGALAFFEEKYGGKVKVYSIGVPSTGSGRSFSKEVCGGPHVGKTGEVGSVKIIKEEAVGSGKRRIYAKLAQIWK